MSPINGGTISDMIPLENESIFSLIRKLIVFPDVDSSMSSNRGLLAIAASGDKGRKGWFEADFHASRCFQFARSCFQSNDDDAVVLLSSGLYLLSFERKFPSSNEENPRSVSSNP